MKIECTNAQKEKLIEAISDRFDCNHIISDGDASICDKYRTCEECVEKRIEWNISDQKDDAPEIEKMMLGVEKFIPLTFEELKSCIGKPMLLYDKRVKTWSINVIKGLSVVYTSHTDKDYIVRTTCDCKYEHFIWIALPLIR